jgi:hypothetical protein
MVNCGGTEYFIDVERSRGTRLHVNTIFQVWEPVWFRDYGIFTKDKKGIVDGRISSGEIDPVYAFSLTRGSPETNYQCRYGMVLDGEIYLSEWFPYDNSSGTVSIPGLEGAGAAPGTNVRVGQLYNKNPEEVDHWSED